MKRKKAVLMFPPTTLDDAKLFAKREKVSLDGFVSHAVEEKVERELHRRAVENIVRDTLKFPLLESDGTPRHVDLNQIGLVEGDFAEGNSEDCEGWEKNENI